MKRLSEYTEKELKALSAKDLKVLAEANQVQSKTKAERLSALLAAREQAAGHFSPRRMRCRYCGAPLVVNGVTRRPQPDGTTVIIRSMVCQNRLRRHTYPLKEIVRKKIFT